VVAVLAWAFSNVGEKPLPHKLLFFSLTCTSSYPVLQSFCTSRLGFLMCAPVVEKTSPLGIFPDMLPCFLSPFISFSSRLFCSGRCLQNGFIPKLLVLFFPFSLSDLSSSFQLYYFLIGWLSFLKAAAAPFSAFVYCNGGLPPPFRSFSPPPYALLCNSFRVYYSFSGDPLPPSLPGSRFFFFVQFAVVPLFGFRVPSRCEELPLNRGLFTHHPLFGAFFFLLFPPKRFDDLSPYVFFTI